MKSSLSLQRILLASVVLALPSLAHAHIGAGHTHGVISGVAHPFSGLDHLLAMVAVGLWAAQQGGRALWAVPASFVAVMLLGGVLAMSGIAVPFVEQGILVSVLLLGLLIAVAARLPLALSMTIVGAFALFHGHAHGTETPLEVSGLAYGAGFVIATAFLHACGLALGTMVKRETDPVLLRAVGVAIVVCGVGLWFA